MRFFFKRAFKPECIDGGVVTRVNSDAPKVIHSTKPIAFACTVSTLSFMDDDLERSVFTFSAKLFNGVVDASFKSYTENWRFNAPPSFMDELQTIISRHDLARFNGISVHVSGLPHMYGAELSVCYESGESIITANNQDCFIPTDAIRCMIELFKKYKI